MLASYLSRHARHGATACLLLAAGACARPEPAQTAAAPTPVERGRYLVEFGGCHDCHTPKTYSASGMAFDTTRALSGHPADLAVPATPRGVGTPGQWAAVTNEHFTVWAGPWGTSFAANLTPDSTGIGSWNDSIFIATIRNGRHLGSGRPLLPPMPYFNVALLTDDDLRAVFAYLRSVSPVSNVVPAPVPPAGAGR